MKASDKTARKVMGLVRKAEDTPRTTHGFSIAVALAVVSIGVLGAEARAANVYIATTIAGAQTFVNRTAHSHWTFATNSASVANFTGGFFEMKKGNPTADVQFAIIVGTYSDFLANYDSATGVYSGSGGLAPIISDSLPSSSFGASFGQSIFSDAPVTLAANTTFTAVLWSAATGSGNDTYFVKNSGNVFWADSSGNPISVAGYTAGGDLVVPTAVPGAGLVAIVAVGLFSRRRRR